MGRTRGEFNIDLILTRSVIFGWRRAWLTRTVVDNKSRKHGGWFVSDGIRWVVDPQHVPHNAANNKSCDSVHYDEWNDKSQLLGCVEWYNHDEFYRNDTLINGTDTDECSGRSSDRGRQYEYI